MLHNPLACYLARNGATTKVLTTKRSQKSPKSGLSIAFKLSFVAASTLTYNCMHGRNKIGLVSVSRTKMVYWCHIILQQRIERSFQTWVTGFSILIFSGNCAFVTRKVDICLRCSSSTSTLISGYMIGSPTSDKAQCLGERPSVNRSRVTPAGIEFSSQHNG